MKELWLWVVFLLINYEQFSVYFFLRFRLLHFSLITSLIFFTLHKNFL